MKTKKRSKSKRRSTRRTRLPAGSESYCYSRGALLMAGRQTDSGFPAGAARLGSW